MLTSSRWSVALVAIASALLVHCSSSSTSVTAPSGPKCSVTASNSPGSFSASGGSGAVTITADRDCTWSVSADSNWISIQGSTSGQGAASVPFAVQSNQTPAARSGSIVVSATRLPVSQAGAPCHFTLSKTSDSIAASGGQLSVGVSTLSGCNWTATSNATWITIQSGQSGSVSGTVVLAVAANPGNARVGTVNVAGQIYTVNEGAAAAAAPTPPPPPAPQPPPPSPTVTFSGTASNVTGVCPAVTFQLKSLTVTTNAATKYTSGNCGNLHNNVQVSGTGVSAPDGSVLATSIAITKG